MPSTSLTFERKESFDINGSNYESKSGSVIVNENATLNITIHEYRYFTLNVSVGSFGETDFMIKDNDNNILYTHQRNNEDTAITLKLGSNVLALTIYGLINSSYNCGVNGYENIINCTLDKVQHDYTHGAWFIDSFVISDIKTNSSVDIHFEAMSF